MQSPSRVFNALGTLALILFLTVLLTTIIPKNMLWFPASERNIKVSTETWESLKDLSEAKSPGDAETRRLLELAEPDYGPGTRCDAPETDRQPEGAEPPGG